MSHNSVTQRPVPMPRQSGLLCRNGRYYLNMRVPTALRSAYGKKEIIRKSLDTSDYREAVKRVRYEAFRQEAEFAAKLRESEVRKRAESVVVPKLAKIEDSEAHEIVTRFFVGLEKESEEWLAEREEKLTEEGREIMMEDLYFYSSAFAGRNRGANPDEFDGRRELDCFIEEEGLNILKDSAAYRKLRPLFHQALLENALRNVMRAKHDSIKNHVSRFREVFSHTPLPSVRERSTLGHLLSRYEDWLSQSKTTKGTHRTYELPARLLREVFGEKKTLDSITKQDVERLFGLLRRAPTNATKRYRGMTLEQAIEAADNAGDSQRLEAKTLENYFNNISAIFNFAVEKELMPKNPAKDRYLRATFASGKGRKRKALFTIDQLNRLFSAPLYIGCQNDESGYAKPGPNKPRRGRFWVPLLSLFHGFRCNEITQLYTEDIREENGIPYFDIREERADDSKSDKHLKTEQSKRRIPIHPEAIRMGFLDYVAERKRDASHTRLFPDLPCGKTGYYSDPFSKWAGRFLKSAIGESCKATFHSLRHHFRDALRDIGASIDDVEAFGGWGGKERSEERHYGNGPSLKRLREQIAKVKYEGLNLSHLYRRKTTQPVASNEVKCRVRTPLR